MSENKENNTQLSEETNSLINAKSKQELLNIETIEELQARHDKKQKKLLEEANKVVTKVVVLNDELEDAREKLSKKDAETEALRKALKREKNRSLMDDHERQEEEGEKASRLVFKAIVKRCREGRYNGQPCQPCKAEMAINVANK